MPGSPGCGRNVLPVVRGVPAVDGLLRVPGQLDGGAEEGPQAVERPTGTRSQSSTGNHESNSCFFTIAEIKGTMRYRWYYVGNYASSLRRWFFNHESSLTALTGDKLRDANFLSTSLAENY